MHSPKLSHAVPFLPVRNLQETISFYSEVLGFKDIWEWGDPVTDARVRRDDLSLLFTQDEEAAIRVSGIDLMLFLRGVDLLYEEYRERGVKMASPIQDKPWGVREFSVKDLNGYYLRFAEGLEWIDNIQKN
jgi:uncharacterized glyoxalase superfamily protein PhnB